MADVLSLLHLTQYAELVMPVVFGVVCGGVGYLSKNKNAPFGAKEFATDVAASSIVCVLCFMMLSVFDFFSPLFRIGVGGMAALLGLDKTIDLGERIINIIRKGKDAGGS